MKPVVSLEDLSITERSQLTAKASAAIKKGILFFVLPCIVLAVAAIYVNLKWVGWGINNDSLRSVINTVLVIGALLPARLFVNRVIQYNKSTNAWKKKVVRGKIHGIDKNTVFISNQKVKLPADMVSQFKVDDEVEIGISQVNDIVIYALKK